MENQSATEYYSPGSGRLPRHEMEGQLHGAAPDAGHGDGLSNMSSLAHAVASSSPPKAASSKYGGGDKCTRCGKTVYFAELREGPYNQKYHKTCFTCMLCNKALDSTFSERQGDVYCKACYGREFGPKGFGFGTTTLTASPDSLGTSVTSPNQSLSPVQRKGPSPSGGVQEGMRMVQQAPLFTSPSAAGSFGGEGNRGAGSGQGPGGSGGVGAASGLSKAPHFGGGDICGRCGKTVYFAEMREGPMNIRYHKTCFSCVVCSKSLDSMFAEHKGELHCKACYARNVF